VDDPGTDDGLEALVERVEQARFTVAFRGFEPREVQDFLRSLADDLRQLDVSEEPGASGSASAPAAPPLAPKTWAKAEAEAAEVVRAAEEEAEQIVEAAKVEAEELRAEATALRDQARAVTLDAIRNANALMDRARSETGD
jgi:DivIVA domain-containing protein